MHIPKILQARFAEALATFTDQPNKYAEMIRGTNDPKFGDYQANCAMPLGKQIKDKNPREVASELVASLNVEDFCETPEIAGPGFINLKLKDDWLAEQLVAMLSDPRCLVGKVDQPKTIVIDYSSPNVAKPMHVGHIRSTVIGDCLSKVLSFLGHNVITDNHLGDWGTQFGMIIYGYKHFGDPETVAKDPVPELLKLYRLVNELVSYQKAIQSIPKLQGQINELKQVHQASIEKLDVADEKAAKKLKKAVAAAAKKVEDAEKNLGETQEKIDSIDSDPTKSKLATEHATIDQDILKETAKLHEGDAENLSLWEKFLPHCKDEINRIYDRLDIEFDHTLGESFYHPMLADVVQELKTKGLAKESDGAWCVFLDGFDAPMIVQKKDGAFLYSTTDIATLKYRQKEFKPDQILYVVDSRQSEHFDKLFAVSKLMDLEGIELNHVSFGTVLDKKTGKPIKTRSGSLIGLESLLDDSVAGAREVVCDPDKLKVLDPPMETAEQDLVSETIGMAAIKYADLSHHRASDYRFDLEKMVQRDGNTATYVQYAFARTQGILKRVGVTEEEVIQRVSEEGIKLTEPAERALALMLLKFEEALVMVCQDHAPNHLIDYLYETAKTYTTFNDQCHVLHATGDGVQTSRLALVVLTSQVLKTALALVGIGVVPRM